MADETRDPELSKRYRALPQDEPGSEIDAAIMAAARRAAETRPAPLVAPTARRRWYFPLAAAAVIVLAVAVSVQVERSQPDGDELVPPPQAAAPRAKERTADHGPSAQQEAPAKTESLARAAPPAPAPAPRAFRQAPRTPAQPSASAPANALERSDATVERHEGAGAAAQAGALKKAEGPEQALERIVELRRQGKDDEADKALAEFRKRYPDFTISEEMLKKLERR